MQSPIALPPSLSNVDALDDFKRVVYFYTKVSLFLSRLMACRCPARLIGFVALRGGGLVVQTDRAQKKHVVPAVDASRNTTAI